MRHSPDTKKTEKARPPPVARKKLAEHTEKLPVRLNEEELLERGQRLAKLQADLGEHYAHEDQVKKQLKSREAELESKRAELSGIILAKCEPREVRVEAYADFVRGVYEEIRLDSGEVVTERPLRSEERQERLFNPDLRKKAEEKKLEDAADELLGHNPDEPPSDA